jgi:hypothetical protein
MSANPGSPQQRWARTPAGRLAYRRKANRKRAEIKAAINALKLKPCMDCGGVFDPVCMDFDHRDPSTKKAGVAWRAAHGLGAALAEIQKCDLVCANCHRLRTHRRRSHAETCEIAKDRESGQLSFETVSIETRST